MKHPSVDGRLVECPEHMPFGLFMPQQPPGAFAWGKAIFRGGIEVEKLYFMSPQPSDTWTHSLLVIPEGESVPEGLLDLGLIFWSWDGSREKPTLRPRIHLSRAASPWAGHLTEGRWNGAAA